MAEKEPFDERLRKWTLSELKVERTKKNIYGERKLNRMDTRIAELEYGVGTNEETSTEHRTTHTYIPTEEIVVELPDPAVNEMPTKSEANWAMWGVIITLAGVIVAAAGVYYAYAN